jgi:hypothetical protein
VNMNAKLRTVLNGGNLTLRLLTFVLCNLILNEAKLNLRNIKWGLHCIKDNHVLFFKVLCFNPLDHQESFYQFILKWILLLREEGAPRKFVYICSSHLTLLATAGYSGYKNTFLEITLIFVVIFCDFF